MEYQHIYRDPDLLVGKESIRGRQAECNDPHTPAGGGPAPNRKSEQVLWDHIVSKELYDVEPDRKGSALRLLGVDGSLKEVVERLEKEGCDAKYENVEKFIKWYVGDDEVAKMYLNDVGKFLEVYHGESVEDLQLKVVEERSARMGKIEHPELPLADLAACATAAGVGTVLNVPAVALVAAGYAVKSLTKYALKRYKAGRERKRVLEESREAYEVCGDVAGAAGAIMRYFKGVNELK